MDVEHVRTTNQRFGATATARYLAMGAANKMAPLRVLRCMALTRATLHALPAGYYASFVAPAAIATAARGGADAEMDHAFIEQAVARGDRCYAAFCNDAIASFAWYSTQPTAISDDLSLHFDPGVAYMYKAYTVPAHRGRRLHGACVNRALSAYATSGIEPMVCYVDSTNFASLRAHERAGFRDFGRIVCVKLGSRHHIHATRGCDRYGVRLESRLSIPRG